MASAQTDDRIAPDGDDIPIEFSGPHPCETLLKEQHLSGETQLPTSHPKMIVVDHDSAHQEPVTTVIDELLQLADNAPRRIPACLQRLVPEDSKHFTADSTQRRAAG